jgi:hypothetical protein
MADADFENDLQALFDAAPVADDKTFAERVDRRLGLMLRVRLMLIVAFGLIGAWVSAAAFGVSPGELMASASGATAATTGFVSSVAKGGMTDIAMWAVIAVMLVGGLFALRPALSES